MILKEKAARWNADKEIQALLQEINVAGREPSKLTKKYSSGECEEAAGDAAGPGRTGQGAAAVRAARSVDDGGADGRAVSEPSPRTRGRGQGEGWRVELRRPR